MSVPSYCRSCGARLGVMDRVYCPAMRCQEEARVESFRVKSVGQARILDDFEYNDVSAMPKERLLALLDEDARKYDLDDPTPDLGFMTSFVVLTEKVKKHAWDDCAKFLAEREEIIQRIEAAKQESSRRGLAAWKGGQARTALSEAAKIAKSSSYGKLIRKIDVEDGKIARDESSSYAGGVGGWGDPYAEDLRIAEITRGVRAYVPPGFYGGRTEDLRTLPSATAARSLNDQVFMAFGPMHVAPNATTFFQVMPQFPFRCTRMLIARDVAPHFVINDLRVGNDLIFGINSIPAGAFVEDAIGIAISFDVVVGILLTMSVLNTSRETRAFSAALCGSRR